MNRETFDIPSEVDGKRDDILVRAAAQSYDASGNAIGEERSAESKVHGDRNAPSWSNSLHPQFRINAGSASALGGLRTGDAYPPSQPWTTTAGPTVYSTTFPLLVWEGYLGEGQNTVVIVPSIWEVDRQPNWQTTPLSSPERNLLIGIGRYAALRARTAMLAGERLAEIDIQQLRQFAPPNLGPMPEWALRQAFKSTAVLPLPLLPDHKVASDALVARLQAESGKLATAMQRTAGIIAVANQNLLDAAKDASVALTTFANNLSSSLTVPMNTRDRPIGMHTSNGAPAFSPQIIKLSFENVEGLLVGGGFGQGPGIIEVRYVDTVAGGNGDYTLYLRVERMN